jgi:3-dehydroquinate synthase II
VSRERVAVRPRSSDPEERRAILERARHRGFRRFVLAPGEAAPAVPGGSFLVEEADGLRVDGGGPPIPVARVGSEEELGVLLRQVPSSGTLALEWTSDRVIPLENAVAARGRRFALWVVARSPSEVPGALGALEHGADLVLVDVRSVGDVDALESLVEGPLVAHLAWVDAPLVSVVPAGVGDRVIVDTTSLLAAEEGLLVGSSAAFLFHVASEAEGSRFSRPRPFRVNAGAAHSYVLLPDGTTRYLSELVAGDPVLVARPGGTVRSARVGRIKIERRPLVVVTAQEDGRPRTVFLQEAESVRLSTDRGRVPTSELAAGPNARGIRLPPARHLGAVVEETIEER